MLYGPQPTACACGWPMAGLFLVLSLCTFGLQRPKSVGFSVPMLRVHRSLQHEITCDGRFEFLRLTKDGKTWINDDEIPIGHLRSLVASLMEDRAERVVYVVVDSEMSYGQFADFLGRIEGATNDLHVVVISGEIKRELFKPRILASPSVSTDLNEESTEFMRLGHSGERVLQQMTGVAGCSGPIDEPEERHSGAKARNPIASPAARLKTVPFQYTEKVGNKSKKCEARENNRRSFDPRFARSG